MNCKVIIISLLFVLASSFVFSQNPVENGEMKSNPYNFSTFYEFQDKIITKELDSLTPTSFKSHPDFGALPYYAPCEDCVELVHKRTDSTRYFVKNGMGGKEFVAQSSHTNLHYRDEQGYIRENLPFVFPTPNPKIFEANRRKEIFEFNIENKYVAVREVDGKKYKINKDLELWAVNHQGQKTKLSSANWSIYSVGKDGMMITDIFPNVDLEVLSTIHGIKTTFVVKNNQSHLDQYKYIFIKDQLFEGEVDTYKFLHNANAEGFYNCDALLYNASNELIGKVAQGVVFDNSRGVNEDLFYEVDDGFNMYLNTSIFIKESTVFPIYIDPLVTTTSTLAQASITGSAYSSACFVNFCSHNLNVTFPAAAVFTAVDFSMSYEALGLCWLDEGAMRVSTGNCESPNQAGFYWFCNSIGSGRCTGTNMDIYPELNTCLPAPSCSQQTQVFTLRLYRCYSSASGCSNSCIGAASPFIVNITGRTLEANTITNSTSATICEGASATLTSGVGQFGIAPYTYSWAPGGQTTQAITVSPSVTTSYSVTVTDACGQTVVNNYTLNVTSNNNLGFTISPNPACPGQNVNITANGNGPATSFVWQTPNANTVSQNGVQSITRTYAAPGTYNITLTATNGSCTFPITQPITISSSVTPSVSITANPSGSICAGTPITFTATGAGLTSNATYQWYLNNTAIAGATNTTYTASNLQNGDNIHIVAIPNNPCATASSVTSNIITITVLPLVTPSVTITSVPNAAVCVGTNVTFTANPTNGGTAPTYQWMVNGVAVSGATGATFSSSTLQNGAVVTVVMTSNVACPNAPTATSNAITVTVNPTLVPSVSIVSNPNASVCAGAPITFTATPTNGGTTPVYQWMVNGAPVNGATGATFTSTTLQNGDVVTVNLTSNAVCVNPATATSNAININIITNLVPTVSITNQPVGTNCAGTNITFTATPTNEGTTPTYQWFVNGNPVAGATGATFSSSNLNNGDIVTVTLNSSITCVTNNPATSNAINMSVSPGVTPTVAITLTPAGPYCAGDVIQFSSAVTNEGTTPLYQWFLNNLPIAGENGSTLTYTAINQGDIITLGLQSNAACVVTPNVVSNNITIDLFQPVQVQFGDDIEICEGAQANITYSVVGNAAPLTYQWQPSALPASPANITPVGSMQYTLQVTDACGNMATDGIQITVHPLPVADFSYSPTEVTLGNQPVSFVNLSNNGVSYEWIFGDGGVSFDVNPTNKYTQFGEFVVRLTTTSQEGCKSYTEQTINIDNDFVVYIPNSFSPGEDKLNDFFEPKGVAFERYMMVIFDRWGNVIYDNSIQTIGANIGWNGQVNGKFVPQGVYVYRIEIQNPAKEDPEVFVGNVNVLR